MTHFIFFYLIAQCTFGCRIIEPFWVVCCALMHQHWVHLWRLLDDSVWRSMSLNYVVHCLWAIREQSKSCNLSLQCALLDVEENVLYVYICMVFLSHWGQLSPLSSPTTCRHLFFPACHCGFGLLLSYLPSCASALQGLGGGSGCLCIMTAKAGDTSALLIVLGKSIFCL